MKIINNLHEKVELNWEQFVFKHSNGTFFQSPFYYKILNGVRKQSIIVFAALDNNELCGIMLCSIQKEHLGILGVFSSRSIIIGGPIVLNNNPIIIEALLNSYNSKIEKKVIYSQFRNLRLFSDEEKAIFEKYGYNYEAHLDILHNLKIPIEEQWRGIHKGRRKNIRRAENAGLIFREIQSDSEFEKAYELVKKTYKRVKLPMPDKSLFVESYKHLKISRLFKIFIAEYESKIIATRMALCYNGLIYDWFAGADNGHLDKYPNDFLPWKVIEWGSLNGYKTFDFGGAGKPGVPYGVRDHKLKFGGELVEHGRFEKVHNKLLFQIGKIGMQLYKRIK
ncbi:MAG: GNAT family N-acetyltransferase [Candidatus Peribacteraceae bacterium]|nr:GNAT family N-acetyltransferase [Candidatus Peribacteraceae bacterium]